MNTFTKRLGLDLDGCFSDFCTAHALSLIEKFGDRMPEGWMIHPEIAFPVWAWEYHHGYTKVEVDEVWADHMKDENFWADLPAYHTAEDSLILLNDTPDIEVIFITNRRGFGAKEGTELWLRGMGYSNPTVLLCRDKVPLISALSLDFYLDDKPETIIELATQCARDQMFVDTLGAAPSFRCNNHIYLQSAPYNMTTSMPPNVKRVNTPLEMLEKAGLL